MSELASVIDEKQEDLEIIDDEGQEYFKYAEQTTNILNRSKTALKVIDWIANYKEFEEFLSWAIWTRAEAKANSNTHKIVWYEILSTFTEDFIRIIGENNIKIDGEKINLESFMRMIEKTYSLEFWKKLIDYVLNNLPKEINEGKELSINVPRPLLCYAAKKIVELKSDINIAIEVLESGWEIESNFWSDVAEVRKMWIHVIFDDVPKPPYNKWIIIEHAQMSTKWIKSEVNLIKWIKVDKDFIWDIFNPILGFKDGTKAYKWKEKIVNLKNFNLEDLYINENTDSRVKRIYRFQKFIRYLQDKGIIITIEWIEHEGMTDVLNKIIWNKNWAYQWYWLNDKIKALKLKEEWNY